MLFDPFPVAGVVAKNRIMVAPMCQYHSADGHPTPWHLAHLGRFALGGAGIVFVEETAVEPIGRRTHACSGIWAEEHVESFRRLVEVIHVDGALAGLQLGHSGLKGSCADVREDWRPLTSEDSERGQPPWVTVGPTVPPGHRGRAVAMSTEDIAANTRLWGEAAGRAARAGFDILEIHSAHGALLHQFLSRTSNQRTDEYGGSLENRSRFLLEVVAAVRRAWPPPRPLFVRLSVVDGAGGTWSLDESVALAAELKTAGVTVIDCSSGGNGGSSRLPVIPRVPGYHVLFASKIKAAVDIPTVAVGRIRSGAHANRILMNGHADIIALARDMIEFGDWPIRAWQSMQRGDPYALHPDSYAFRLRRRDRERSLAANNLFPVAIPVGVDRFIVFDGPEEVS